MSDEEIMFVKKSETTINGHYKFSSMEIQLPNHESDITLILPNGKEVALQYRMEGPTMDICLPEELAVTNWEGDDMSPAPPLTDSVDGKDRSHERLAKQICIGLPRIWFA